MDHLIVHREAPAIETRALSEAFGSVLAGDGERPADRRAVQASRLAAAGRRRAGRRGRRHYAVLRIIRSPITSRSIFVRRKQSSACPGVFTTGSFSLNDVFNTSGTPVASRNASIRW